MMSDKFVPRNQHDEVRSDTAELQFLVNESSEDLLHDNSFTSAIAGGQAVPTIIESPQNQGNFSTNDLFSFYGTLTGNPGETGHHWYIPVMPSSLPTSQLPSTGSDTYDTSELQSTDQSMLDLSSFLVRGYGETSYYNSNSWNPDYHSLVSQIPQSRANIPPITARQSQIAADFHTPTLSQKRKRFTGSETDEDDNSSPHNRRSDLRLLLKYLKNPSVNDLKNIAKDIDRSFDFVVGCFLRQMGQSKPDSYPCNAVASASQSTSRQESGERFANSVRPTEDTGSLSITEVTIREKNLAKRPGLDARKAASDDTKVKTHRCSNCTRAFTRRADLTRHMKIHFPSNIPCLYRGCGKVFNRKDKLDEHWRKYHQDHQTSNMPKNPIRRDEGPDPDSGGPRSLSDRFRVIKRNQPPSGSRGGSSSIRSGCSANKHSSSINFGLNFEIETSSLILSHQLNSKGIKHFATAEVIRKLGRGGFGSVYEVSISSGTGANSRRSFACKTIQIPRRGRCEVINRAKNEISVLRVLDNPNIIKLAGAFILDDRIFINTFPVADCNLKEFLNKQPSPLLNQVKKQIWQGAKGLASALTYLHGYGTGGGFHGDIKPENILVIQDIEGGPRMTFLLADFGSAKMPLSASIISTGRQAVTLKYCAPEWFKNEGKMGPPSDIWSFGCILMQIVTYLHDKTMTDFEAFRASRLEQRDDWTYHEALPAVNSWLQSLSLHFTHLARPILRKEHIDMIAEMLLHNPNERLSAADVVSQMGAESSETLLEGNATSHCGSTSMLRSQWVPQGGDRVFNSLFLLPESILREEFQRQPTSDTTV